MKFTLTMNMDNASFGESGLERSEEVVRILSEVMGKLNELDAPHKFEPGWKQKFCDMNGNTVGMMEVS